jgi:phage-related protein
LGYGGTQEEMKRLLKDAEAISGIKYDISSFADVTEAIHVMQEEMGIAGTTAREASSTIEGSLSMMKASWENLVVGMADENANMDTLINNFVESTATAAQNLIPRIEQTLAGIGQLITAMAPIIAEALPVLVESLLPTIITAGISLITALANAIVTALPAIYAALMEGVQIILVQVFGVSEEKAGEFADGVTSFFVKIKDGFMALVKSAQTEGTFLNAVWTGLQNAAKLFGDFLVALWNTISTAFTWCVAQIQTEGTLFNTIWENIKTFISAAVAVIQGVIRVFTAVLQGDWSSAWSAVQSIAETVWNAITSIISSIVEWITGFLGTMVEKGFELINSLAEGIQNKFAELFTLVGGWVTDNIINPIADMGTDLYNAGVELLNKFWEGLVSVWESISSWWDGLKLSDKTANVNTNARGNSNATGLNYVPFDGYPAILHRGEAVLTSAEANVWRKGGLTPAVAGGITINQYIQSVPQTPVELANATEAYFEQARWML